MSTACGRSMCGSDPRATHLVEFAIIAPFELVHVHLLDGVACLVPEAGELATLVILVANVEVGVTP